MTRICADCFAAGRPAVMGEKCPKCGEPALLVRDAEVICGSVTLSPAKYFCTNLRCEQESEFDAGAGGHTHGCCETCLDRRYAELEAFAAGA